MKPLYLVDTNIIVHNLNGDEHVSLRLTGKSVRISTISVGELLYGALKSGRPDKNVQKVNDFVSKFSVLDCTQDTADHFGRIKASLSRAGRPIPDNDIWIAATAIQHGATLVSRDAHFTFIPGLITETW